MRDIILGICPFLAATKNSLEEAKIPPLTAPKVEQATKNGIIQDITPRNRFPKVWKRVESVIEMDGQNSIFLIRELEMTLQANLIAVSEADHTFVFANHPLV